MSESMFAFLRRLACRWRGHRWIDTPIRYEHSTCRALIGGRDGHFEDVSVTWVCDEVCARCGGETWWPS